LVLSLNQLRHYGSGHTRPDSRKKRKRKHTAVYLSRRERSNRFGVRAVAVRRPYRLPISLLSPFDFTSPHSRLSTMSGVDSSNDWFPDACIDSLVCCCHCCSWLHHILRFQFLDASSLHWRECCTSSFFWPSHSLFYYALHTHVA